MTAIAEAYREQKAPDLTAEEIENIVQNAVRKYLSPEELASVGANKPYLQGRTRAFSLNEICALQSAVSEIEDEDEAESDRLHSIQPLDPDWIKGMKNFFGKKWVLDYGGDFTATEIKYGKDWLEK